MKAWRRSCLLSAALWASFAAHPLLAQTLPPKSDWHVKQQLTVALPGSIPNHSLSEGEVELQVLAKSPGAVRIEVRCLGGCSAHYTQDLEDAEFHGALLIGVHPDTGDIDIATLWGEGTGWTIRVLNVTPTKVRSVLEAHTNAIPEFKLDYSGYDALAVPDDVDVGSRPWRYDGATIYEWNGSRFTERRIKHYRPREGWHDRR
jgi:hypothetical protein